MKELFDAISQVGFPIVVSVLLLVRIESKMKELSDKIESLNESIIKLTTIIDQQVNRRR